MVVYGSDEEALGQIGRVFFEKGCNGYDPKMIFFFSRGMMISSPLHILFHFLQFLVLYEFFLG